MDISREAIADLEEFLLSHEGDIDLGFNDFGDLRRLFIEIFLRAPKDK